MEVREESLEYSVVLQVLFPYLYSKHFPWVLLLCPSFSPSYFKNSLPCLNFHLSRTLTKTASDA